eukprot:359416-Chlamydomonas_euryale.AAC.16
MHLARGIWLAAGGCPQGLDDMRAEIEDQCDSASGAINPLRYMGGSPSHHYSRRRIAHALEVYATSSSHRVKVAIHPTPDAVRRLHLLALRAAMRASRTSRQLWPRVPTPSSPKKT